MGLAGSAKILRAKIVAGSYHMHTDGMDTWSRKEVMEARRLLVTGATGLVGSHVAAEAVNQGHAVAALLRHGSDRSLLDSLGVHVLYGDVTDVESVRQAVADVDMVVHCAAKVGDWGPVAGYRRVNVEGLRNLLEAARGRPLQRFVHLSTLGV